MAPCAFIQEEGEAFSREKGPAGPSPTTGENKKNRWRSGAPPRCSLNFPARPAPGPTVGHGRPSRFQMSKLRLGVRGSGSEAGGRGWGTRLGVRGWGTRLVLAARGGARVCIRSSARSSHAVLLWAGKVRSAVPGHRCEAARLPPEARRPHSWVPVPRLRSPRSCAGPRGGGERGRDAAGAVPSPDPPPGFKPAPGPRGAVGPARAPGIARMAALAALAKKVWSARRLLVLLLTPLALLPVVFALPPKEGRCLFVILLMAVYWCTEALPLSVTALLPIVLFPFLGILPSSKVCPQYFLDTNFLFLSGLIMATAIEEWNLHRRIALKVLMLVGVQPARLILGMMVTTSFLSMWLSNTASTAMMLPIANAILKSLFGQKEAQKELSWEGDENTAAVRRSGLPTVPTEMRFLASTEEGHPDEVEAPLDLPADSKKEEEYRRNIWKGFLISIPYSASIGGTATLTGTAPNLILLGQLKSFFPQCDVVNFGSWFIFALPLMLLFLLAGWLWISFLYGGLSLRGWRKRKSKLRVDAEEKARAVIREEFQNLGPIKFAEQAVFILFCTFAILLFSRDPKFIPGWASLFPAGFVSDAVTSVAVVIILFFFPSQRPSLKWWFDLKAPNTDTEPLLTWRKAQETVPWNVILLLGGGFAMAKGCEESGLSAWIGGQLHPLQNVPPVLAVLLVTVVIAFFTEFASNTATIVIFLPILAELAIRLRVHPLYLMIPGTVGCSYAFMLPVSTPPNSIAFASGHLLVKDMVRTGLLMNVMGVLLLSVAMNTWAQSIFQLGTFPDWANNHSANITEPLTLTNDTFRTL